MTARNLGGYRQHLMIFAGVVAPATPATSSDSAETLTAYDRPDLQRWRNRASPGRIWPPCQAAFLTGQGVSAGQERASAQGPGAHSAGPVIGCTCAAVDGK